MGYLKKNFPENYNFQSISLRAFIVKAFIEFKKQTQKIFIILTVLGKLLYSYVVSQYKNTFNLASLPQGLPSAFRKKTIWTIRLFYSQESRNCTLWNLESLEGPTSGYT